MTTSVQFSVNLLLCTADSTTDCIGKVLKINLKTLIAMGRFLFQGLMGNVETKISSEKKRDQTG